jgi:hypothetical protein
MGLPDDVRRKENFNQILIAREWPELLDIPVNTPTTRSRLRHKRRAVVRRLRRSTDGPPA